MLPDEKIRCHLSGYDAKTGMFRARCRDIIHKCSCPKYVRVLGKDPNVENGTIDFWGCADSIVHTLAIEGSRQTFHVSAELAELRKEMDNRDRNHEAVISGLGAQLERSQKIMVAAMGSALSRVEQIAQATADNALPGPDRRRALEHTEQ